MLNKHLLSAVVVATAVAASSASAFAIDIPLANGSFDTGTPASNTFGLISNWTFNALPVASNQLGVFTSYVGFTPSNGPRMALLSNQGVATVQLRQALPIQLLRMPYLSFQYMYLTTDAIGTADASRDRFSVVVDYFSDAAGLNQIGTETILGLNSGPLLSTGINPGAPFGGTVNATSSGLAAGALRNASVTLSPLFSLAPYANFTFYLENNGTGPGVSGVLLDNVVINPEPGTLALFGLGAAGLAAFAWRRRKARPVAATS